MRILLDTHLLLWFLAGDERLPPKAKQLVESTSKRIFVSAASMWEICIKSTIGRIDVDLSEIEPAVKNIGFEPLPVSNAHALATTQLPLHHRDPFDRMLVAQALLESARLLTHDGRLKPYGSAVMLV